MRPGPYLVRTYYLMTLLKRAKIPFLHYVPVFLDGARLLAVAEQHGLEGIVSKRTTAPYRSGECRDWRKIKTVAWHEANRERRRLFEQPT